MVGWYQCSPLTPSVYVSRNAAPRIFKHYIFPSWPEDPQHKDINPSCTCPPPSATFKPHMYFSSSPGMLTSVDDFYTAYTAPHRAPPRPCHCPSSGSSTDSGSGETLRAGGRLVVLETSLDVHEPTLYDLITPTSLLSWVRVRSANLMATDGAEWTRRFSYDHSGTYANQWMVLDMSKFQPASAHGGAQLQSGLFTVVEEMPGMMRSSDQTTHLQVECCAIYLLTYMHLFIHWFVRAPAIGPPTTRYSMRNCRPTLGTRSSARIHARSTADS